MQRYRLTDGIGSEPSLGDVRELRGRLRATLKLTKAVEIALEGKQLHLRYRSYADPAVSALVRRSTRLARTIALLARLEAGADAVALCRSLLDCWIVPRRLANQDAEARGRMFWRFEGRQQERVVEVVTKYPPSAGLSPPALRSNAKRVAAEYSRWDSWGPGMKAMAREPELLTPETWTAIPPEWAHETLYFAASCVLHPTALGLRHASLGGGDIFTFSESNPESEQQCRFALGATTATIAHIGNRASVFWSLGLSDEIKAMWECMVKPFLK
jgi:hypothetical protein